MIWTEELRKVFDPYSPARMEQEDIRILSKTPEWYTARRGRCTASKRSMTIASADPKQWRTMKQEIEYELSPKYERETFSNVYMEWGNNHEAQAIANVELEFGVETYDPGLLFHPDHVYAGGTPDFFIGDDITGQIKCPYMEKNHLKYIYDPKLEGIYYYQVQWEAWVSQRKKIIFMSYDPRQPLATRCAIIELDASMELWDKFDSNLLRFKKMMEGESAPGSIRLIETVGIPELF